MIRRRKDKCHVTKWKSIFAGLGEVFWGAAALCYILGDLPTLTTPLFPLAASKSANAGKLVDTSSQWHNINHCWNAMSGYNATPRWRLMCRIDSATENFCEKHQNWTFGANLAILTDTKKSKTSPPFGPRRIHLEQDLRCRSMKMSLQPSTSMTWSKMRRISMKVSTHHLAWKNLAWPVASSALSISG